jgi:hypothetical protein
VVQVVVFTTIMESLAGRRFGGAASAPAPQMGVLR